MSFDGLTVIILAAGMGTRFGESYTKLLHPILGKPLIYYPIQNLKNLGVKNIIAVISDLKVEEEIRKYIDCEFVYQKELTGTADAVKLALNKFSLTPLRWEAKTLMVLNGDDATLYSKETLEQFLKSHETNHAQISMMTIKTEREMEVGRIIRNPQGNFSKILEYKEYIESAAKSNEINCGVYLINLDFARTNLPKIPKSPNGEYYLTDLLNLAKETNLLINLFVLKDHSQWIGVNSKKDLKYAEKIIKRRSLDMKSKNFSKTVHFLGIAGSGTSACAKLAEAAGFIVSGCDSNLSGEFADILGDIKTFEGHNPNHLEDVDILALTPAILSLDKDNPEILAAKEMGIKVLTWQKFTGEYLTKDKTVIAVCGTHGKSTTTAMVGKVLEDAGVDPIVLMGATVTSWGGNFRIPTSSLRGVKRRGNLVKKEYFVVEADEFNDNFLSFNPDFTIVTNIEFDHPEFFKDISSYKISFQNFLQKTKQLILANLSDENSKETLEKISLENFSTPIIDFSKNLIDFSLKIHGQRNNLNASAAYNLGLNLGIDPVIIKKSLQSFLGIGRRMELIGNINGAKVYSDFGHHPTEIKITVEALRQKHHDRGIIVLFQPHMFSRTKALFGDFVKVFRNLPVKKTYILDIYPSREKDEGIIHSKDLVKAIDQPNVEYAKNLEEITKEISPNVSEKDIIIFMGAGDIDTKARLMIKDFKNKKVLVLGLGLNEGGVGSARFFAKQGAQVLVSDLKDEIALAPSIEKLKEFPEIKYHLGGHSNEDIDWADLIIKNQAIKPNNPYLKYAKEKGKEITTDIGIFLESVQPIQLIGITGTKGKSTTASLIYAVIKKLHLEGVTKIVLAGNIGNSVLDSLDFIDKDTLVVLEISSFQLESFDRNNISPKYAVITNIYPDHLNYYDSMDEYVAAKKLIAVHQNSNDYLFINKADKIISSEEFLKGLKSQIIFYSASDLPKDFKPKLPGDFNLSNIAAALAVSKTLRIGENLAIKTLQDFKGVEFRMQLIKDWNGIKIYNNTTATAPEPAIESLKVFPNCILICGGMNKGLEYKEFASAIGKYAKAVYFLSGDATEATRSQLSAISQKKIQGVYDDLGKLLIAVKKEVKAGDVILFSPGATSFNLFQNEFDRGRKFNEAVERVFK